MGVLSGKGKRKSTPRTGGRIYESEQAKRKKKENRILKEKTKSAHRPRNRTVGKEFV